MRWRPPKLWHWIARHLLLPLLIKSQWIIMDKGSFQWLFCDTLLLIIDYWGCRIPWIVLWQTRTDSLNLWSYPRNLVNVPKFVRLLDPAICHCSVLPFTVHWTLIWRPSKSNVKSNDLSCKGGFYLWLKAFPDREVIIIIKCITLLWRVEVLVYYFLREGFPCWYILVYVGSPGGNLGFVINLPSLTNHHEAACFTCQPWTCHKYFNVRNTMFQRANW